MHFMVIAYDNTDDGAYQRRCNAREEHLENAKRMLQEKKFLYAAALLDDKGKMIGSTLIVDFPSKTVIEQEWLNIEPYVTDKVWNSIEILPCKVPDFCLDLSWMNTCSENINR